MDARRTLSLQTKLVGVVLTTTLVALMVAIAAMVGNDLRAYHESWLADMETQAQLIGRTSAVALSFDDPQAARANLAVLGARPQVRAAAVYGPDGSLFATYPLTLSAKDFPPLPQADGARVEQRQLVVFRRVVDNGETLGTVYLRADYELFDRLASYAGIALGVLTLAMAIAWMLSSRLQRLVTGPILAIASVAREVVEKRDYARRAPKMSEDEVGTLAESFNDMMAEIERRSLERETALTELAREVSERRLAQQEVMRLNEGLEQHVLERTAQLETSNRELALATETAEKANRAKSEFISAMSHELRTPLNAILGFGQLLVTPGLALTDAKRIEFTEHILKAGGHLLSLINEVLDLARIESANLMLSLEPVALAEMLEECRVMLQPSADERSVRLVFPPLTRLSVVADRTRLKQVLLNLLSNAIKYNRPGGTVVVDCAALENNHIRVEVRDTGLGLRPEQLVALFQPFNRLGQEASGIEGTGIGLVVTKRLIEFMGGRIGVDSREQAGSNFWFEMKAASDAHAREVQSNEATWRSAESISAPLAGRPMLLYVEDNPANLRLVEEIVSLRGDLRQIAAPDAQLGIELARVHRPQVILMDINLPGLSGADAQAILRDDPGTRDIPVIALTANAMPRDRFQGLAAGFFEYITKPIDVEALNQAIDNALATRASRRP
jgi:signal transduction histidine kinase/ActR/RegA family two-component response regulator